VGWSPIFKSLKHVAESLLSDIRLETD
jgi:hypothetical protein